MNPYKFTIHMDIDLTFPINLDEKDLPLLGRRVASDSPETAESEAARASMIAGWIKNEFTANDCSEALVDVTPEHVTAVKCTWEKVVPPGGTPMPDEQ